MTRVATCILLTCAVGAAGCELKPSIASTDAGGSSTSGDNVEETRTSTAHMSSTAATTQQAPTSTAPPGTSNTTREETTTREQTSREETTTRDQSSSRPPADTSNTTTSEPTSTSAAETSSDATSTEMPEGCGDGPLSEPIPNCQPEFEETGDYYADCVARINQFRWECQCLPPLERNPEGEDCADQHSQYDYEQDEAHAGFRAMICDPSGSSQNECPGYGGRFGVVDYCLQQMWDEGPGEDFQEHGHYLNMTDPDFTAVACGIYTDSEGVIWAVQNFFR
jgi:uncharacterized protein YkwD